MSSILSKVRERSGWAVFWSAVAGAGMTVGLFALVALAEWINLIWNFLERMLGSVSKS